MLIPAILVLASSLLISLILTAVVQKFAIRYGFVAPPQHDRWHKDPTALLGGIGIFLAFLAPLLFFVGEYPALQPILLGAFLICGMGLIDDFIHCQPYTKLIGQIVVSCALLSSKCSFMA